MIPTTVGLSVIALVCGLATLQTPSASPVPGPATASASDYTFRTTIALLIFHVRPDRAADFEAVMSRIVQGFESATDPIRQQQRAGWRVLRSTESGSGEVLYVALIAPVVSGADYDPVRMVTELLPGESSALYERLREAVTKVERVGLADLR